MNKFTILLAAVFGFVPSTWAESVKYLYPVYNTEGAAKSVIREWKEGITNATVVSSSGSQVTWGSGWYVVKGDVTLGEGVYCSDDAHVHLVLCDVAKLTASPVARKSRITRLWGI